MSATRTEFDSLGAVEVDVDAPWGAQTQRAIEHFAISSERMPPELIQALAAVKCSCARVNGMLGRMPLEKVDAIVAAATEVVDGGMCDAFPLSVWQTGSGTQTNMNLNEVIARRASQLMGTHCQVHPNDDVNLGQSSNDVFPTAMHVAIALGISRRLLPALAGLCEALSFRTLAFADIVKMGRTHLQDATPLTLGQEFSAYMAQLEQAGKHIEALLPLVHALAIGGTAVGTGLNTPTTFGPGVAADLAAAFDLPFVSADNKFAALAAHDGLVAVHGGLRVLAVALHKIANDIRWLASGPRSGLGELRLPENEPGSSIMPGKVNPTQCEALIMVCYQVMGNDVVISMGGASGNFELNVCKPLIAHNVLQSIRLLGDAMCSFERYCVRGIAANRVQIDAHVERSLMLVTALVPHIGYDLAASIARTAHVEGKTLRDAALASGAITAADFDRWVRPASMIGMGARSTDCGEGHAGER